MSYYVSGLLPKAPITVLDSAVSAAMSTWWPTSLATWKIELGGHWPDGTPRYNVQFAIKAVNWDVAHYQAQGALKHIRAQIQKAL